MALILAQPKVSPAYGDPGYWLAPALARTPGRTAVFKRVTAEARGMLFVLGWSTATSGLPNAHYFRPYGTELQTAIVHGTILSTQLPYDYYIVLRATGAYYFLHGGAFTYPTLIWIDTANSNSNLYPCAVNYNAAARIDDIRVPKRLYLPPPLAYDTFARADGAIGSSEAVGPESQAAPALAWSGATWTIASEKAINTPTTGVDACNNPGFETAGAGGADVFGSWTEAPSGTSTINDETSVIHGGSHACRLDIDAVPSHALVRQGTPATGTWYVMSAWAKISATTGQMYLGHPNKTLYFDLTTDYAQYTGTFRAPNTNYFYTGSNATSKSIYIDDVSIKALTLASLFATQSYPTTNVCADITLSAYATNTQAGLVLRLDSAAAPANFIIAYQEAGKVWIDECVSGTYTSLGNYTSAFATGDTLRVILDGAAWRLYKLTSAGTPTLLGAGTTNVVTGTRHGLFSTDARNTLDNWLIYARGSAGEYAPLITL